MQKTLFASLVASFGMFLYGYSASIIAGTLLFIAREFQLSDLEQELVVSIMLISAMGGALAGGSLADYLGRKKTLFVSVVFFFFGTIILMKANALSALLLGRFVTGIGVGIVCIAAPLYIAEMSPASSRGALVTLAQLMTTIGILVAYVVAYVFADKADWRDMFGLGAVLLTVFPVALLFVPESPLWLSGKIERQKVPWKALWLPHLRKAVWIGLGISVFQQITGINTIIYYAPKIFEVAGFKTAETAIFETMLVGIVNVVFSVIALFTLDRLGRRVLLITGLIVMSLSLAALIGSLHFQMSYGCLFSLLLYVAAFAISLGPIVGLLLSEIFPQEIRGRAMGLALFVNWLSNYIVSLTFLTLLSTIGIVFTFGLFMIICLFALWFAWKMVPETKGIQLN